MSDEAPHLTAEEVRLIREAFARRRRPGSFEPGKWAVSHYNRDPQVLGAAFPDHYPESVVLRDITLRVIEQTPGVTVDRAQRRRLGEALLDAGVTDIEVSAHGWGMTVEDLKGEVDHLRSIQPGLRVKMGATQTETMVETAARVGVTLAEFWLPALPEVTPIYWSEAYRVAWEGGDWRKLGIPTSLESEIARARQLTAKIKEVGLEASAGINVMTLVDDEHIARYCTAVAEAGVDQIWLSDGPAGIAPEGWNHIIKLVRQYAPKQKIGTYIRNTYGLAVATSLAAVHAGADIIEVSVNGTSATAGQVDLAQLAVALEVLYGVHTGIRLDRLTSLARLVEDISGVKLGAGHAVTGTATHNWGGIEIVAQELKVEPLLHWTYEPSLVGGEKQWIIDRTSGMWTLRDKLEELRLRLDREAMPGLREAIVTDMSVRRRALTDSEIRELALRAGASESGNGAGSSPREAGSVLK
jgi:isopropylmalate/homocitrate/citramalate synthase